jgi:hypothetical protein
MTLSLLMIVLMTTTLVILAGTLVLDAVRARSRSAARRVAPAVARNDRRTAASGARNRGAVPTRS